ncbi:MAG: leucine-rich repeat protein [Acutalibacteraceae bacterium]
MRKILLGVFAAALILLAVPSFNIDENLCFTASAKESENGFYYTVADGEATVTGTDGSLSGDITVPVALGGYLVTAIGERAFDSNSAVKSVKLPSAVKVIGNEAFYMCAALESVTLPSGLKTIGNGAFQKCSVLKSITVPSSVTLIGDYAFDGCFSLESVGLSKGLITIGDYAFNGCKKLAGITFPSSLTTVGAYAFSDCVAIKNLTLPDNIVAIGEYAFSGCTGLTGAVLPLNLTVIEKGLFFDCVSLKSVILQKKILEIKTDAFVSCENLKSIIIPDSTQYIRKTALGYNKDFYGVYHKVEGFVVYGAVGSVTETYCKNNELTFRTSFTVGKPQKVTSNQSTSAIKLTWTKAANADGYRIYYKKNGSWTPVVKATTSLSHTFTKLPAGQKYTFAVRAYAIRYNDVIWSETYTVIETATKAPAPATVKSANNFSAIKISWNKCQGADGYRIYNKTADGWKVLVKATTDTSYMFINLKPGTKAIIAVRPYIVTKDTVVWSDYKEAFIATNPSAPSKIVAEQSTSAIKLTWSKVSGATGYAVFKKDGGWKYLGATDKLNGTIKNLSEGTKYTFAVRSFIKYGSTVIWGAYKEIETATSMESLKVNPLSDTESILLSWQKKSGADGYRVYYKTSVNGKWKIAVSSTKNTQVYFDKLPSGRKYTFVVRPYILTSSGVVWGKYGQFAVTTKVNSGGSLAVTYGGVRLYNATSVESVQIYKKWGQEGVIYYECKNSLGEILLYAKYGTVWRGVALDGTWYDYQLVEEICQKCGKTAGYGNGQCSGC